MGSCSNLDLWLLVFTVDSLTILCAKFIYIFNFLNSTLSKRNRYSFVQYTWQFKPPSVMSLCCCSSWQRTFEGAVSFADMRFSYNQWVSMKALTPHIFVIDNIIYLSHQMNAANNENLQFKFWWNQNLICIIFLIDVVSTQTQEAIKTSKLAGNKFSCNILHVNSKHALILVCVFKNPLWPSFTFFLCFFQHACLIHLLANQLQVLLP